MQKTLNDWIEEFYPIKACDVKGGNKELLEHSLKKWKGATEENTEAYNCTYIDYRIVANPHLWYDEESFSFGFNTCALCQVHKYEVSDMCWAVATESDWIRNFPFPLQTPPIRYDCDNCIIVLSGNPSCPTEDSAYAKSKNDPSPMIALLEKLLQETNENQP